MPAYACAKIRPAILDVMKSVAAKQSMPSTCEQIMGSIPSEMPPLMSIVQRKLV